MGNLSCKSNRKAMEAQKILREQMDKIPVNQTNATAFYNHLFTVAPELRKFFKGAENINPDDIHKSERFQKQGTRLLTSIHVSIELMHNDECLKHYVNEIGVMKHRQFKIPFDTMKLFFPVFQGYVEKMTGKPLTDKEKEAWAELDKQWMAHYKAKIDELGLP